MFSNTTIDKNTPIPLYYQLKQIILDDIKNGHLTPGDMIPAELELTKMFNLSRTTVRQAIIELVNEGHLYRIKGKGTFIAKPKIEQDFMTKIESFKEQMFRKGYTPSTKVLEKRILNATGDIAKNLVISEGDLTLKLKRLRYADSDPIVIVDTYLSANYCNHVYDYNLADVSLYDILSMKSETKIVRIQRTVEASVAGKYESDLLCIPEGFPIQIFHSIGYNTNNIPMEYSIAKYRGDMSKFKVTITL
ncbi:GntR family transcriptional regulator [Vallitalea okinawensis]|uniref:GntR family transcriptional regulator n=1 Tax=Vallitalea okinawensis TaxID=2078660 RepID=UPI000CFC1BF3|nr:GntR family transcriptional regulator [Vallitalea okinawensis]